MPEALIAALHDSGVKHLTCVSNNARVDGFGLGQLPLAELLRHAVRHTGGHANVASIQNAIQQRVESGALIREAPHYRNAQDQRTSPHDVGKLGGGSDTPIQRCTACRSAGCNKRF
jgi:hypothetical protein